MNQQTLSLIWTQIVKDMTYDPQGRSQINTFFLIDNPPEIHLDTLGATYQDYLDRLFWSRDWVNGGANPNNLKGQLPAIFAETVENTVECLDSSDMVTTWAFVLVDKLPCETCPNPNGITAPGLKDQLLRTMRIFLNEFYTYEQWVVDFDGIEQTVWISRGRVEYYKTVPTITLIRMEQDIESQVQPSDTTSISEWGNMPLMRGYVATMQLYWCDDITGNFDYSQDSSLGTGVATCC